MRASGMFVGDNLEKSRRMMEVAAGKVKKALCVKTEGRRDVTVDWRRGMVYVGRDLVAKWHADKMMLIKGEVLTLQSEIDILIKGAGVDGAEVKVMPEP